MVAFELDPPWEACKAQALKVPDKTMEASHNATTKSWAVRGG